MYDLLSTYSAQGYCTLPFIQAFTLYFWGHVLSYFVAATHEWWYHEPVVLFSFHELCYVHIRIKWLELWWYYNNWWFLKNILFTLKFIYDDGTSMRDEFYSREINLVDKDIYCLAENQRKEMWFYNKQSSHF